MLDPNRPAHFIDRPDGHRVAYRTLDSLEDGAGPGILFLPGFKSDMQGSKALALEAACAAKGRAFTRLDYLGHGESTGDFTDGTIGRWAEDAIAVLDAIQGPQILVGSSMGGWIMLLMALARPDRVAGLVGIAPAPDFTEDLMWPKFSEEVRTQIMETGRWDLPSPYDEEPTPITKKLIEDGRHCLVLRQEIPLTCPVRLIHGLADPDVPWEVSLTIQQQIASSDVLLTFIKNGDHRLSDPVNLQRIVDTTLRLADDLS